MRGAVRRDPVDHAGGRAPGVDVAPGSIGTAGLSGATGSTAQIQIGPGFTNQGIVVIGAAGGAVYAQKPNEYRRTRWEVTLKMDDGATRVVSLSYEPLFVQVGDY